MSIDPDKDFRVVPDVYVANEEPDAYVKPDEEIIASPAYPNEDFRVIPDVYVANEEPDAYVKPDEEIIASPAYPNEDFRVIPDVHIGPLEEAVEEEELDLEMPTENVRTLQPILAVEKYEVDGVKKQAFAINVGFWEGSTDSQKIGFLLIMFFLLVGVIQTSISLIEFLTFLYKVFLILLPQ